MFVGRNFLLIYFHSKQMSIIFGGGGVTRIARYASKDTRLTLPIYAKKRGYLKKLTSYPLLKELYKKAIPIYVLQPSLSVPRTLPPTTSLPSR